MLPFRDTIDLWVEPRKQTKEEKIVQLNKWIKKCKKEIKKDTKELNLLLKTWREASVYNELDVRIADLVKNNYKHSLEIKEYTKDIEKLNRSKKTTKKGKRK